MRKNYIIPIMFTIALIVIIGVSIQRSKDNDFLKTYGLDRMSVQDMVRLLEDKLDEPYGFQASISGEALFLNDGQQTMTINLPDNLFYVSIAPYIHQTHPCGTHNLITCRGELVNQTFFVQVVDLSNQQVVMSSSMKTYSNGFAGIWLPKNGHYQLNITYGQLSASEIISTFSNSLTCVTTTRLA